MLLDALTSIGTIGAVAVGMWAIYHSNKNSRREILTHKLEEIYVLVQSLSRNYGSFMKLYFSIEDLRGSRTGIQTLADYYEVRDGTIPILDRQKIIADLSRLEILSKCYAESPLLENLAFFEDLMFSFSDLVFNGGSLHKELKWKEGFPDYEKFYGMTEDIKAKLIHEIKKR